MMKTSKSYREPGLPLSVGLLGIAFMVYGLMTSLFRYGRLAAIFGFEGVMGTPVTDSTPMGIAATLFPLVLAVLGAALLLKSAIARDLIIGVSYVEIFCGGILAVVSMMAPQSLNVLFPFSHISGETLYLFSESTWPAIAVAGMYWLAGIVQLSVLNAKPTRRAFGLAY